MGLIVEIVGVSELVVRSGIVDEGHSLAPASETSASRLVVLAVHRERDQSRRLLDRRG